MVTSQKQEIIVNGHVREKRGYWHLILRYRVTGSDKYQEKSKSTGLVIKGNKRRADQMLQNEIERLKEALEDSDKQRNNSNDMLFSEYMKRWLRIMKPNIALSTYAGYYRVIYNNIAPYFDTLKLTLQGVSSDDIQDYYTYCSDTGLSNNTILRHHANIRKALQMEVGKRIPFNPATLIERPKPIPYVAQHYNETEIERLLQIVKGDPVEFAVIMAAFYGLRRSEIIGLKESAFDLENDKLTIRHTVIQATVEGKNVITAVDKVKNKSSLRTLPLVDPIKKLLLRMREEKEYNRILCGNSYSQDYQDYVYFDLMGQRYKPDFVTAHFPLILKKNGLKRIRFHDLRHSCATLLHNCGIPAKEIQAWLGHSTIQTTMNIYTHLDFDSKDNSANALLNTSILGLLKESKEKAPRNI